MSYELACVNSRVTCVCLCSCVYVFMSFCDFVILYARVCARASFCNFSCLFVVFVGFYVCFFICWCDFVVDVRGCAC